MIRTTALQGITPRTKSARPLTAPAITPGPETLRVIALDEEAIVPPRVVKPFGSVMPEKVLIAHWPLSLGEAPAGMGRPVIRTPPEGAPRGRGLNGETDGDKAPHTIHRAGGVEVGRTTRHCGPPLRAAPRHC